MQHTESDGGLRPARASNLAELSALIAFERTHPRPYSGYFRLQDDPEWCLDLWFRDNDPRKAQLLVFGTNADGSLYALWSYAGQALTRAPVVYIDHENDGSRVLAFDTCGFIGLLCIGVDELGWSVRASGWSAESPSVDVGEFRRWANLALGIAPPEDPENYVIKARESHPDFEDWLNTNVSE